MTLKEGVHCLQTADKEDNSYACTCILMQTNDPFSGKSASLCVPHWSEPRLGLGMQWKELVGVDNYNH